MANEWGEGIAAVDVEVGIDEWDSPAVLAVAFATAAEGSARS